MAAAAFAAEAEFSIKPPVSAKRAAASDLASERSFERFGLSDPEVMKVLLLTV